MNEFTRLAFGGLLLFIFGCDSKVQELSVEVRVIEGRVALFSQGIERSSIDEVVSGRSLGALELVFLDKITKSEISRLVNEAKAAGVIDVKVKIEAFGLRGEDFEQEEVSRDDLNKIIYRKGGGP